HSIQIGVSFSDGEFVGQWLHRFDAMIAECDDLGAGIAEQCWQVKLPDDLAHPQDADPHRLHRLAPSTGVCTRKDFRCWAATSRKRRARSSTTSRSSDMVTPKAELRPGSDTPMLILSDRARSASVRGSIPFQ